MVLILSTPFDNTTDNIIDWLYFMGIKYNRLNDIDFYQKKSVQILIDKKEICIVVDNINVSNNIDIVWLRRWGLTDNDFRINATDMNSVAISLLRHFKQEFKVLTDILFAKNKEKFFITNPNQYEVNKISTLLIAQNIGLKVPDFLISNNKTDIVNFRTKNTQLITKPLSQLATFKYASSFYYSYTSVVNASFNESSSDIGITFFQKKINKQYEVRVFYLLGECYSMAIFSQFDEKTAVDFRSYNEEKPNRYVPYTLPSDISRDIGSLMEILKLDTGSLDFIVSTTGEFFFLEVNPVGQFGMLSFPCKGSFKK